MNFETFKISLDTVKIFDKNEDYEKFDRLTELITGEEGIQWLNCLLDAVCVKEDNGPYEGLYNAIYRFPSEMVGRRLGEYLPSFQERMSFAPFQVWRFYTAVHQDKQCQSAFITSAINWSIAERETGLNALITWSKQSAKSESNWKPVLYALGYIAPPPDPMEEIPANWPEDLKERLRIWRMLPPDDTSKKVFWDGGKAADGERWKQELPYLVEALALKHAEKWRDIKVWLNPLGSFGRYLYDDFIAVFLAASQETQSKALENIKETSPAVYMNIKEKLDIR